MYIADFTNRMKHTVLVIGCGGTGGFVAEGLCRLLTENYKIILQDYDRVEERNLIRQNFFESDLGKFKSQALAERLSTNYKRAIGYKVVPFGMHYSSLYSIPSICIGCVDGPEARRAIASEHGLGTCYWIDAGNSYQSGQVLIGNSRHSNLGAFYPKTKLASAIPLPSVQLPSILEPVTAPTLDCATAVQREEQSPVINQMMATLVLQAVHALINHKLTWMATYVDLEVGSLSTIPIEPKIVARLLGVKVDTLINKASPPNLEDEDEE